MPTLPLAEIFVEGLSVVCIIGDLPHERTEPQKIRLHLSALVDISAVAISDDLKDSVDYVALAKKATHIAQQGRFHLVETMVAAIARGILEEWKDIESIQIRVEKMGCISNAQTCGVQIKLSQQQL